MTPFSHWSGPASTIFIPSAIDFIGTWIFFSLLLYLAQGKRRGSVNLWAAICAFFAVGYSQERCTVNELGPPPTGLAAAYLEYAQSRSFLFTICLRPTHRAFLNRLRKQTIDFLCIVAVAGALILIQLAWFGWEARGLDTSLPLHQTDSPASRNRGTHPRFIWIVLDELSYQQVYGRRFQSLSLPTF